VLFLIVSFFGSHQGFVQSSGSVATRQSWEAAGNREVRKVELSSGPSASPRHGTGRKNLQSEISGIGTLSFLWCSFQVKRIAFIS
jgi:hypothetical protein